MNVFVVETPPQLMNALEARHTLAADDSVLIVILQDDLPQDAYAAIVQPDEWSAIHYVQRDIVPQGPFQRSLKHHPHPRVRGYFATYGLRVLAQRIRAIARSLGPVQNVFIGNYWIDYMRHVANVIDHRKLILLDDGTATLLINDRRREGRPLDNYSHWRRARVRVVNLLAGIRAAQAQSVTFFTIYDLVTKKEDRVVKHNYSYLRSLAGAVPPSNEVFFLGQTLVDEGLSRERYMDYLRKIIQYFKSDKIVYVAHKLEPQDKLAYIRDEMGLPVVRFGVPIEFQMTVKRARPKLLASFCSSALENCRIIFGDKMNIKSFYLDPGDCPLNPEFIKNLYAYYESKS